MNCIKPRYPTPVLKAAPALLFENRISLMSPFECIPRLDKFPYAH